MQGRPMPQPGQVPMYRPGQTGQPQPGQRPMGQGPVNPMGVRPMQQPMGVNSLPRPMGQPGPQPQPPFQQQQQHNNKCSRDNRNLVLSQNRRLLRLHLALLSHLSLLVAVFTPNNLHNNNKIPTVLQQEHLYPDLQDFNHSSLFLDKGRRMEHLIQ
ncbi:hypothetical protein BCR33DRAFT_129264 [Rhizoclosmatium globosum]|uniref:Uncharacterized protein n=1 Tax=Rhizoclosmatium globosum TaxID=329046 RepID=A0A1Y2CHE8_9FUNG|nr:hypothetical protein BCR33DRAFT_129264 [Rhizoclosmatium globosum]|eukprot:ORY46470.1 hypothetical protein BCR33DRAFT_129264 [Rhizoclosmatium globosum]